MTGGEFVMVERVPQQPAQQKATELSSAVAESLTGVLERSHQLGFLGPGPFSTHLEHALAFLPYLPASGRVMDLGSGGGIPGLVLAVHRPDLQFTFVDASERRIAFLRTAVRSLGLDSSEVLLGRAEILGHDPRLRSTFECVVARSFGSPAVLAECAVAFLADGASLVSSEPPEDTDRWPAEALLRLLGLQADGQAALSVPRIQRLKKVGVTPEYLPRKIGEPARKPLF